MSTMTTLEILKAARKLITPEERWTQGAFARSESKRSVSSIGRKACSWCAEGALEKITSSQDQFSIASWALLDEQMNGGITDFNDVSTHAEVLAAFDRAIAKLEAK